MRPGRTRTGMSLYCSPYILFMHLRGTGLKTNSEQFVFVLVAGLTQVICTGLRLYCSHVKRK